MRAASSLRCFLLNAPTSASNAATHASASSRVAMTHPPMGRWWDAVNVYVQLYIHVEPVDVDVYVESVNPAIMLPPWYAGGPPKWTAFP